MIFNRCRNGDDTPVTKLQLFHGTDSLDAVRGICIDNFDPRVSGKNATRYGDGAYFARTSKYSHCYTDSRSELKFMFVASVLVGDAAQGHKDLRKPPEKPGQKHESYDSCVDDINQPTMYILFDRNQHYPEYLIQYKDVAASQFEDVPQVCVWIK